MSRHLNDSDFRSEQEKWEFLRDAPRVDATEPAVADLAHALWVAASQKPERFVRLAMAYCRDVVEYQSDTERVGQEDLQPKGELSDIIDRGVDDCDGKARLFVALCLAAGIPARMSDHWKANPTIAGGEELYHVSAFVTLAGRETPIELTLYRARAGDDPVNNPDSVPKETSTHHWDRNEVKK